MEEPIACLLCAYNEEEVIKRACETLVNQTVEFDEFYLIDSGSHDRTVELAEPYIDGVIHAPKGKLSARNYALDPPADADWDGLESDIVLNTDADKRYPSDWASKLIAPFNDPFVVGVTGETRYMDEEGKTVGSQIADMVEVGLRGAVKYMFSDGYTLEGGNSAIRKHTFQNVGGFDTSWVDESEIWQVFHEEEFYLPRRMAQKGRVLLERSAVAYEPPRRLTALVDDSDFASEVDDGLRM